ncbi:hypothetical protein JCM11641_003867 [Rhodosporidiobolus odoratus]
MQDHIDVLTQKDPTSFSQQQIAEALCTIRTVLFQNHLYDIEHLWPRPISLFEPTLVLASLACHYKSHQQRSFMHRKAEEIPVNDPLYADTMHRMLIKLAVESRSRAFLFHENKANEGSPTKEEEWRKLEEYTYDQAVKAASEISGHRENRTSGWTRVTKETGWIQVKEKWTWPKKRPSW